MTTTRFEASQSSDEKPNGIFGHGTIFVAEGLEAENIRMLVMMSHDLNHTAGLVAVDSPSSRHLHDLAQRDRHAYPGRHHPIELSCSPLL